MSPVYKKQTRLQTLKYATTKRITSCVAGWNCVDSYDKLAVLGASGIAMITVV